MRGGNPDKSQNIRLVMQTTCMKRLVSAARMAVAGYMSIRSRLLTVRDTGPMSRRFGSYCSCSYLYFVPVKYVRSVIS